MSDLAKKRCVPCQGGVPPLRGPALEALLRELGGAWRLVKEHHLEKEYDFPSFREAMAFANRLADLAEAEGHHPEMRIAFRKVGVSIWTHKIDGLTESDFVLAAKIDAAR